VTGREEERRCDHLAGDGEDAAGHGIPGGGEAKTSPETTTPRLAASSPAEVRPRT
jgi:hypothetical protein